MIKKIAQSNKIFTQLNSFALQEFCETRLNRVKILILTFSKLKLFNGVHPIKYHKAVISPKAKSFNRVNQKKIGTVICLLIFLFLGLFYLPIKKVSSAGLEVVYPQIAGTTITADTKLPVFLKYLFDAGMFLGFFAVFMSLGIAGAMYLLSPAKPDWLADAKDRVGGAISGLLILALTYLIITTINPQLKFFGYNELPAPPPGPSAPTKALGVYLYGNASDCPDNPNNIVQPHTSSVPDLGLLRNKVSMVEIVQGNGEDQPYYISILYDHINFWGKCKWIPASPPGCQYANFFDPEDKFATSASVYEYDSHSADTNPANAGVYLFRKPCFNKVDTKPADMDALVEKCKTNSGGWYFFPNSDIANNEGDVYVGDLNSLSFQEVPELEQDCVKYDDLEKCISRQPPTLGGENTSSIIINGSYLVLFVYYHEGGDAEEGPWTSCQEFPKASDVNKIGPQQMKWENIRNNGGVIPNYVLIVPIKGNASANACAGVTCTAPQTCNTTTGVCQ